MKGNYDRRLRKLEEGFGERAYERIIERRIKEALTLEQSRIVLVKIMIEASKQGYTLDWILSRFPPDKRWEFREYLMELTVRSRRSPIESDERLRELEQRSRPLP
jgi:hypothetical protein